MTRLVPHLERHERRMHLRHVHVVVDHDPRRPTQGRQEHREELGRVRCGDVDPLMPGGQLLLRRRERLGEGSEEELAVGLEDHAMRRTTDQGDLPAFPVPSVGPDTGTKLETLGARRDLGDDLDRVVEDPYRRRVTARDDLHAGVDDPFQRRPQLRPERRQGSRLVPVPVEVAGREAQPAQAVDALPLAVVPAGPPRLAEVVPRGPGLDPLAPRTALHGKQGERSVVVGDQQPQGRQLGLRAPRGRRQLLQRAAPGRGGRATLRVRRESRRGAVLAVDPYGAGAAARHASARPDRHDRLVPALVRPDDRGLHHGRLAGRRHHERFDAALVEVRLAGGGRGVTERHRQERGSDGKHGVDGLRHPPTLCGIRHG